MLVSILVLLDWISQLPKPCVRLSDQIRNNKYNPKNWKQEDTQIKSIALNYYNSKFQTQSIRSLLFWINTNIWSVGLIEGGDIYRRLAGECIPVVSIKKKENSGK